MSGAISNIPRLFILHNKIDMFNCRSNKNTYRTLMTRGQKGCYVYFVDEETRQHFAKDMESSDVSEKSPVAKSLCSLFTPGGHAIYVRDSHSKLAYYDAVVRDINMFFPQDTVES